MLMFCFGYHSNTREDIGEIADNCKRWICKKREDNFFFKYEVIDRLIGMLDSKLNQIHIKIQLLWNVFRRASLTREVLLIFQSGFSLARNHLCRIFDLHLNWISICKGLFKKCFCKKTLRRLPNPRRQAGIFAHQIGSNMFVQVSTSVRHLLLGDFEKSFLRIVS